MAAHLSDAEWDRLAKSFQVGQVVSAPPRKKRSKYNAKAVVVTDLGVLYPADVAKDQGIKGRRFDSRHEGLRFVALIGEVQRGRIDQLECQPEFELHAANGTKVGAYRGDFRYRIRETGQVVVEDAKGVRTAVYRLKKKLVEAEHGLTIREV